MKKRILPIVIVFVALIFILPGIAIARNASSSNPDSSLSSQPISADLIGGQYRLTPQLESVIQSNGGVSQGGHYFLSQPNLLDDGSGCCCKGYLTCIENK